MLAQLAKSQLHIANCITNYIRFNSGIATRRPKYINSGSLQLARDCKKLTLHVICDT